MSPSLVHPAAIAPRPVVWQTHRSVVELFVCDSPRFFRGFGAAQRLLLYIVDEVGIGLNIIIFNFLLHVAEF